MLHSMLLRWITISILIGIISFPVNRLCAQVNLPTGTATASIPFYNYNDKNRLAFTAGLQYISGNGVKVNDLASVTGLGWRLNAGGVVSRMVAGKPDDQYGNFKGNRVGTGRLYANYGSLTDCYNDISLSEPEYMAMDREADVFSFDLNGRTGSFVISRKAQGETKYKIKCLNDSKLKIELLEEDIPNVLTRISRFMITTEEGIEYVFSEKELTEVVTTDWNNTIETVPLPTGTVILNPSDPPPSPEQITVKTYRTGKYIINNWYLSEIRNVLSGSRITFEYNTYDLDFPLMKLPIKTETLKADGTVDKVNYTIVDQRFVGKMKHISRINFPQNKQLEFLYADNRQDMPGESVLAAINIKSNGNLMDSYAFNYQYFRFNALSDYDYTFPQIDREYLRLSLKSIDRNFGQRMPFVSFAYCAGMVAPRASWNQDYFGYFTGSVNAIRGVQSFFMPSYRQTNIAAQNGMLKQIKYAAGGYLEYEYELRTCKQGSEVKLAGGVRVKKTTVYDGIDHANDQVKIYKYINEDGTESGAGYDEPVFTDDVSTYYVVKGTHLASKIIYFAVNAAISYATANPQVVGQSTANTAMIVGSGTRSTGFLKLIDDIVSLLAGQKFEDGTIYTRTNSGFPLASQNPLPVIYERVEVIQGDENKNIGKIVYGFSTYTDRPSWVRSLPKPYSLQPRVEYWTLGLPKTTSYYDAAGKLVTQTTNQYRFITQTLNSDTTWVSCKCGIASQVMPASIANVNRDKINFYTSSYYPVTGRAELVKTTTQQFYLDNTSSILETSYEYDPDYFNLRKTVTQNSTGENIEKRIYYAYNYNVAGLWFGRMKDFNLVSVPVSTETWLVKPGSPEKLLNAAISDFIETGNGDIKPYASYELQTNKPVEQIAIGVFDPTKLNRAPAYIKKTAGIVYNSEGDMVQQDNNGDISSFIYAYDVVNENTVGKMIAAATNAPLNDIAFTGFETTGTTGGWEYHGTRLKYEGGGGPLDKPWPPLTGTYYYLLSTGNIIKSGLTAGKKYKLTYWGSKGPFFGGTITANLNVSNTMKQGVSVNGYTYVEHEFTAGDTDLEISGSCFMDDVRLYPVDAQMTTYDYDSFDNVVCVMDENNVATWYIYDNRQRLLKVTDRYGNILKVNEYKD